MDEATKSALQQEERRKKRMKELSDRLFDKKINVPLVPEFVRDVIK